MLKKNLNLRKTDLIFHKLDILLLIFFIVPLYPQLEIDDLKESFTTEKTYFTDEDFIEETKTYNFSNVKTHFTFRVGYIDEYIEDIMLAKDNLQSSLYFYNRSLISYNEKLSLGYVFLHKPNEVEINNDTFKYFLRKWWIKKEDTFSINKIILGNYKVNFGYAMTFSENSYVSEYFKNINPKSTRITPDNTSSDNANFYGIAIEDNIGSLNYMLFFSQKDLIIKDTDYLISNSDLLEVRNEYVEYDKSLLNYNETNLSITEKLLLYLNKETLFGLGFLFTKEKIKAGFCSYYASYEKAFDPDKSKVAGYFLEDKYSDRWKYVFRGNKLLGSSIYYEMNLDKSKLFIEVANSLSWFSDVYSFYSKGWGLNVGFLFPVKNHKFSLLYTFLQPTFFSPFGSPFRIYRYFNSQNGVELINFFSFNNLNVEISAGICEILKGIWSGHFSSELPRYPSLFQQFKAKLKYKIENITLEIRSYNSIEEKYINSSKYNIFENSDYIQTSFITMENLYKIQYEIFESILIESNYYQTLEKLILFEKNFYTESFFLLFSYILGNLKFVLNYGILSIDKQKNFARLEQIWKDVYSFKLYSPNLSDKSSFIICYDIKKLSLWLMYEYFGFIEKASNYNIKLQLDVRI